MVSTKISTQNAPSFPGFPGINLGKFPEIFDTPCQENCSFRENIKTIPTKKKIYQK